MAIFVHTIGRAKIRISDLNDALQKDGGEYFDTCNKKYEKKINSIAAKIAADKSKTKLIMLSGPSASGKTTTSIKLQNALESLGIGAVSISMDDFFKNREDAPVLPDGTKDFESLEALDIKTLESSLNELISKGAASLPVFNFKTGRRSEKKRRVLLTQGQVAVVEGLHALDTAVTGLFPQESTMKIYVSVSSDFVDDEGNAILKARDLRLLRRTVRDASFRSAAPEATLEMWDKVCRGEDLYVRPFKKYADVTVNSAFACEPCLFKAKASALFEKVKDERFEAKVKSITGALSAFGSMPESIMPASCVLREFFGGSEYYNKAGNRR